MGVKPINSNFAGACCERIVEKYFAEHGYHTFLPMFGQNPPSDLIVTKQNKTQRVQVKKGTVDKGSRQVRASLFNIDRFQKKTGIDTKTWREERKNKKPLFDILAIVYEDRVALMNDPELWHLRTSIKLCVKRETFGPSFGSYTQATLFFEDFENPKWL